MARKSPQITAGSRERGGYTSVTSTDRVRSLTPIKLRAQVERCKELDRETRVYIRGKETTVAQLPELMQEAVRVAQEALIEGAKDETRDRRVVIVDGQTVTMASGDVVVDPKTKTLDFSMHEEGYKEWSKLRRVTKIKKTEGGAKVAIVTVPDEASRDTGIITDSATLLKGFRIVGSDRYSGVFVKKDQIGDVSSVIKTAFLISPLYTKYQEETRPEQQQQYWTHQEPGALIHRLQIGASAKDDYSKAEETRRALDQQGAGRDGVIVVTGEGASLDIVFPLNEGKDDATLKIKRVDNRWQVIGLKSKKEAKAAPKLSRQIAVGARGKIVDLLSSLTLARLSNQLHGDPRIMQRGVSVVDTGVSLGNGSLRVDYDLNSGTVHTRNLIASEALAVLQKVARLRAGHITFETLSREKNPDPTELVIALELKRSRTEVDGQRQISIIDGVTRSKGVTRRFDFASNSIDDATAVRAGNDVVVLLNTQILRRAVPGVSLNTVATDFLMDRYQPATDGERSAVQALADVLAPRARAEKSSRRRRPSRPDAGVQVSRIDQARRDLMVVDGQTREARLIEPQYAPEVLEGLGYPSNALVDILNQVYGDETLFTADSSSKALPSSSNNGRQGGARRGGRNGGKHSGNGEGPLVSVIVNEAGSTNGRRGR